MNWEAVGAIGQAVSALALIFVLVQVRHAREDMQRTAGRARLEGTRNMILARSLNPELASAFVRMQIGIIGQLSPFGQYAVSLGLSETEAAQVGAYNAATWCNIQISIESIDRLSPSIKEELRLSIRGNYGSGNASGNRQWYEFSKATLNPTAVRYVDNLLAQPG